MVEFAWLVDLRLIHRALNLKKGPNFGIFATQVLHNTLIQMKYVLSMGLAHEICLAR